MRRPLVRLAAAGLAILSPSFVLAQDPEPHVHPATSSAWSWTGDANAFVGFNYQQRKFRDFSAWESQNWFMLQASHPFVSGALQLNGMLSLEPLTIEPLGSPQVFQTGESYHGAALIDRQHPHDLFMELGATYRLELGPLTYIAGADLVGPATLGPTPFMHRESARSNPEAPLTHHYLDSTHITPGVVRGGVEIGTVTLQASWFRGEEPDDYRVDIERPRLDSWAVQGLWRSGPWVAQVSGGILHRPAFSDPYDIPRITASVEYTGTLGSHPFAATVAWGENREIHGILDGYLLEWQAGLGSRGWFYGRAESAAKDLLDLGAADPPGFISFHRISHVASLTVGYIRDVSDRRWGRLGIGGDATTYHVPDNMIEFYGSPHSLHIFLRYRAARGSSPAHRH